MFVFRIVSSNSTETQTESSKAATYRTSRYNNNEVLSKNTVWWPVIDKDIKDCYKACTSCATAAQDPTGVPLCQWKLPLHPLQRVHIDYAVPFKGKMWLLLIDTFVKWPEIHEMKPTTTEATISKLKHIFTAQGLPEQIISDNGPQFTATKFQQFCNCHVIVHSPIAPYHPRSNGEIERLVAKFKNSTEKANPSLNEYLQNNLINSLQDIELHLIQ